MKTLHHKFVVGAEHLDGLDHGNWEKFLVGVSTRMHDEVREAGGWGLETLKSVHQLALIMRHAEQDYFRQVRMGDIITVRLIVWYRLARVYFQTVFCVDGKLVAKMSWQMPFVTIDETEDGYVVAVPDWIRLQIGEEQPSPEFIKSLPATAS